MKVLHIFDRYLNTTMNWAHRLVSATPIEHHISAIIQFESVYRSPEFKYHLSPLQRYIGLSKDEWHIRPTAMLNALFGKKWHERSIKKYIEENGIDLIHFHFATVACDHMNLIKDRSIKKVISFYGYDYEKAPFKDPSLNKKYSILFEEASAILCEGNHGKKILIDKGCTEGKIQIVPLGIDIGAYSKQRAKTRGSLRLLQPATFTPKKGQLQTLQAFNSVKDQIPNATLTLIGEPIDHAYFRKCQAYIEDNTLNSRVNILPFKDHKAFMKMLTDYDVVIQPSHYSADKDCEGGAPVALIDAQASGLPVISTYHCDIPDVVLDETTGLLSAENDPSTLAKHIERFYRMSKEEYIRFSNNARNHVTRNYNIRNSGRLLHELYQNLLK